MRCFNDVFALDTGNIIIIIIIIIKKIVIELLSGNNILIIIIIIIILFVVVTMKWNWGAYPGNLPPPRHKVIYNFILQQLITQISI